jgi:hypothetical protein
LEILVELEEILQLELLVEEAEQVLLELKVLVQVELVELAEQEKIHHQ